LLLAAPGGEHCLVLLFAHVLPRRCLHASTAAEPVAVICLCGPSSADACLCPCCLRLVASPAHPT
jgi:hypothetical protein